MPRKDRRYSKTIVQSSSQQLEPEISVKGSVERPWRAAEDRSRFGEHAVLTGAAGSSQSGSPELVSIDHVLNIRVPEKGVGFPVLDSDWNLLRRAINRMKPPRQIFRILGSGALSVAGSLFVASFGANPGLVVLGAAAGVTFLWMTTLFLCVGLLLLLAFNQESDSFATSQEDVLREMDRIEK